ncbi:MAG: hypothetical protein DI537_39485 [Stutzerimonas stutzeri]|nr:MAG: hypothetical protein DI537_39485 [Stutzerimonas stutzeri]
MPGHDLIPILDFVRDATEGEAALVVLDDETLDLMAVLKECGDYTLVERARPDPTLPIMHFVRCPSQLWAERLECAWAQHRLLKATYAHR